MMWTAPAVVQGNRDFDEKVSLIESFILKFAISFFFFWFWQGPHTTILDVEEHVDETAVRGSIASPLSNLVQLQTLHLSTMAFRAWQAV